MLTITGKVLWLSSIETLDLAFRRDFNFNIYGVASSTTWPVLINEVITKLLRSCYKVITKLLHKTKRTREFPGVVRASFFKGTGLLHSK